MPSVACSKTRSIHEGNRCDERVHASDWTSNPRQLSLDLAPQPCRGSVEGMHRRAMNQPPENQQRRFHALPMKAMNDLAHGQCGRLELGRTHAGRRALGQRLAGFYHAAGPRGHPSRGALASWAETVPLASEVDNLIDRVFESFAVPKRPKHVDLLGGH